MQTLGILILTAGVWLTYSGVVGIPPLETLQKILNNPTGASTVIGELKLKAQNAGSTVASAILTGTTKVFTSWAINRDFNAHKRDGSVSPGVDFGIPVGTPVPTPVSGLLTFSGPNTGGYGNLATVVTKDGYRFHFGHMSKFRGTSNREVTAGTVIGESGGRPGDVGAGNSTGAHLHLDIQTPSGQYIDPMTFLANRKDNG